MKKSMVILLLASASSAYGIEPYQAQQIEVYRGGSIKPYQAESIKPYQAESVQPYQAESVKPYQPEPIQPQQARPVQPYQGAPVREQGAATDATTRGRDLPRQESSSPAPAPKKTSATQAAKALIGTWQTNIPGAVYTTPSGLTGYDILHVSSGAAAGLLKISANGTYSWNSYGGKKGKWVTTSDPEYPIVIIDTVENRRWRVGYSAAKGTLFIWDGSIWYEGRKAAVKK